MLFFRETGTQTKVHAACKQHNVKKACSEFEKETSETLFIKKNR